MHKSNTKFIKNKIIQATSGLSENFQYYIIEFDPKEKEQPKTNFDEIMNFWTLPDKLGKKYSLDEVCEFLVTARNEMPLWIKITMDFKRKSFLLLISKRFRKIKEIDHWHIDNELRPIII